MSKIAVVFPTRNRPELLKRFIDSIFNNCYDKNAVNIYLYVDDDDKLTKPMLDTLSSLYSEKIFYIIGPRILMSETANKLIPLIKEDIVFLAGDDLIIRTKNWDKIILQEFDKVPDKIALLYGDDLNPDNSRRSFATHPIIHRKWFECLGYLTPPYFSSDYADTWLNEIADNLKRKIKIAIVTEHMHWTFGKSPLDSTYLECRQRFSKDNPPSVFNSLIEKRKEDFFKLAKLMEV